MISLISCVCQQKRRLYAQHTFICQSLMHLNYELHAQVPVTGDIPSSRGLHSLTAVTPEQGVTPMKLFLFGGAPQRGPMVSEFPHQLHRHTTLFLKHKCTRSQAKKTAGAHELTICFHHTFTLADGRSVLPRSAHNGVDSLDTLWHAASSSLCAGSSSSASWEALGDFRR